MFASIEFGTVFVVIILGICAFSLAMRATGKGDVPDNMAKGMMSWWFNKLK
jgi:hypothetical protein